MNDTKTISLCHTCYRHIPAERITKNNAVYLNKTCPEHGHMEYLVETDVEFYNSLIYDKAGYTIPDGVLIEVTDKCNLNCPHCYHRPDNRTLDKPINIICSQVENRLHSDAGVVILAGAEPTVRKDLPELITQIRNTLRKCNRKEDIAILTNGVKFSDRNWTRQIAEAGITAVMIGMNHCSYQGKKIHEKQLIGIDNCIKEGIFVYYVGYTLEHLDHMEEVLEEIQSLGNKSWQYRIRAGSDIGRSPDEPKFFLSRHVAKIKEICERKGWTWEKKTADDNLYHYMVNINGIPHRIIQWSDPKTIDLEQLQCGPWCDFVPGKPVTNFLHQIMLRDAVVNEGKLLHDTVPEKYMFKPNDVKEYELTKWTYKSQKDFKEKQLSTI